eukprot:TRINITY_DN3129_c0_g1_i1.p1 TRINITY_DN3129_c0_g1~~TRINITY_DN3129_c0_g1_i1.p1  ORF type:complete len:306 (+),score=58.54 TRINITY_DN3129_c0_g1_i1:74-991(+)
MLARTLNRFSRKGFPVIRSQRKNKTTLKKDLSQAELEKIFLESHPLSEKHPAVKQLTTSVADLRGGNYAHQLFELAALNNELPKVNEELKAVYEANANRSEIDRLFDEVRIDERRKIELFTQYERSGVLAKASKSTKQLLNWLVRDQNVEEFLSIARNFNELYKNYSRQWDATITTARPLPQNSLDFYSKSVQNRLGSDKVNLKNIVDPSIVDGYIITIGEEFIQDRSWKTQRDRFLKEVEDKRKEMEGSISAQITVPSVENIDSSLSKMEVEGAGFDVESAFTRSIPKFRHLTTLLKDSDRAVQ